MSKVFNGISLLNRLDMTDEHINSLWYTTDEEPEKYRQILYLTNLNICKVITEENYIPIGWKVVVKAYEIVKWLYVDDILPSDKNE